MKYPQHNPLPIPDIGPTESIDVTMASIFDWEYALKRENLLALYEKGKANTWNATDLGLKGSSTTRSRTGASDGPTR